MASKKTEVIDDDALKKKLLTYFELQMQPYGISDILSNLHLTSKKTQVIKCLESLTEEKLLNAKQFGKSTVWVINLTLTKEEVQSKDEESENDVKEEYIKKIDLIKEEKMLLSKEISLLDDKLNQVSSFILDEKTLVDTINTLEHDNKQLKDAITAKSIMLEELKQGSNSNGLDATTNSISELNEKVKGIIKKHKKLLMLQKRLTDNVLDITPGLNKKKLNEFVIDSIGCEVIDIKIDQL